MTDSLLPHSTVPPLRCLLVDDDPMAILLLTQCIARTPELHVVGSCTNAVEALHFLRTESVDVLFLDILMPLLSGVDLLHLLLHHLPKQPYTVLVTSSDDHAVQAYDYGVVDYLLKPINFSRFRQTVDKIMALATETETPPLPPSTFMLVKVGSQFVRVTFAEVYYLEARGGSVHIRLKDQELVVAISLRTLCRRFPVADFLLIHRSFLVNIQFIEAVEETDLLIQRQRLPISALLRPELLKKLNRL